MKTRLENQIAIVTGSSSGNGRAIALALSSAGATVVCADLNKNARKEGYEEDIEIDTDNVIQRRGGKAVYVQADVRCASEIENLMTRTISEFGRLDIIVNNAGVVNAVCPGLIPTALTRPTTPEGEQWHGVALQDTPWPRLGTPQDVAHCVLFLASPEAEWVTGVALAVDGGASAK
jgi:NAD(P)-dependent dehydrogenase (short-subunit alcohol dehydrogenase family)